MTEQSDMDSLRAQIYERMSEKETEELVAIWQENDRDAWTDDAFDAVKAILLERLGELPEQELDDLSENPPEKLLAYPTDKKLFWIADLSTRLSYAILFVAIVFSFLRLINYFFFSQNFSWSDWANTGIFSAFTILVITFLASIVDTVLYGGFTFLVLQAITEGIYLLMDIRDSLHPEADMEEIQP
jgi:hypothetical protein